MINGASQYLTQNPVLTLFLICHVLSDYQLQSQRMADQKEQDLAYLGYHIIGVSVPLICLTIVIPEAWLMSLLIMVSHALIDWLKPKVANILKWKKEWVFLLDQCLHIAICLFAGLRLAVAPLPNWLPTPFLLTILFILLITKPTNIVFKLFFGKYQPDQGEKMDTIMGAGATIGNLERIVIGICMIMGQFASIGLVFTAKSIARYNKISENPAFAEYYLIGSLFSILSVFIAAWLCFF
ncbi:UNVERIFIED_CONTAM: DUF3307 domain-containing protein [Streptococcus canis]|uniref:DUF3307 domain-containing protein n=1 Tax=Streptococcus canis TaxID=1329 RepID=A0AAE4Q2Q2_STRCB|nr:DUF3307 domain-containing protein [Streptococcus canis]MDV5975894.1 DUF3307 domain-containing protein [Streptococcus canis]